MDTLLILRDTITAHVIKVVDSCQLCAQEAPTNCNDVKVVAIICLAIVLMTLIAWGVISSWKCKELRAQEKDILVKEALEKEKTKNKTDADSKQRKIDLQNKLLAFLEKNTSKGDYNKDKPELLSTMKDINSKEAQYYIKVLKALIDDTDIPEFPQDIIEK